MIVGDSPDSSSQIPTVSHSRDTPSISPVSRTTVNCYRSPSLVPQSEMNVRNASEFLETFVKQQSGKIQNLERDMRRISTRFGARERALVHQISSLRDQLQQRTLEFQEKISDFHTMLSCSSAEENTIYTEVRCLLLQLSVLANCA